MSYIQEGRGGEGRGGELFIKQQFNKHEKNNNIHVHVLEVTAGSNISTVNCMFYRVLWVHLKTWDSFDMNE